MFDWLRNIFDGFDEERSYTDAYVELIRQGVSGEALVDSGKTAVQETCAGYWGRAFASADISPNSIVTRALTPGIMETIGRQLVLDGEVLFALEVENGQLTLQNVSSWNVLSENLYECTIPSPNEVRTRYLTPDSVLHLQYGRGIRRPWTADGPLQSGSTSLQMAATLEAKLTQEVGGPVGNVLPYPQTKANMSNLQSDIKSLGGKTVLVPTTASGWGEGEGAAPKSDWRSQRIGADPPDVLVKLRDSVNNTIVASAGVPAQLLYVDSEGTGMREAYRQFLHGTIAPVAKIIREEMRLKLEEPMLDITFEELFASDVQGRARAYQSLVGSKMDAEKAARATGFA